ncbi:MAG: BspA family leucine-rich repeat surface protein [Clostridia bacterium]|nr:BspA family leucine-rich repeat surface protein [Clostridia bacterium]
MGKVGNRVKSFCLAIIAMFVFGVTFLLAGCRFQLTFFQTLKNGEFSINRVVYTDKPARYFKGKTLLTGQLKVELSSSSSITIDFDEEMKRGTYAYYVDEENKVIDVIENSAAKRYIQDPEQNFPTTFAVPEYYMIVASMSIGTFNGGEETVYSMVANSAKHLFSGTYEILGLDWNLQKEGDPDCDCGYVDQGDMTSEYWCGCRAQGLNAGMKCSNGVYDAEGKPVDTTLGLHNSYGSLDAIPRCCYSVTEIFTTDETTGESVSTNTFQVSSICNGRLELEYGKNHQISDDIGGTEIIQTFDFKELVIDGFDLNNYVYFFESLLAPLMQRDDFSSLGIMEMLNFNDFGYMFSDLPCEKITINDIKFVDDFDVVNLSHMFANCPNLATVNFGNFFHGLQPEDVSYMFYNCPNLAYVDLTSLDTTNVTNMAHMFDTKSTRNEQMEIFINEKFIDLVNKELGTEFIPHTNNGQSWTWDTAAEYFAQNYKDFQSLYQQDSERAIKVARAELITYLFTCTYVNRFGLTYDELAVIATNGRCVNVEEFVGLINSNPEEFGLSAKPDGNLYTTNELLSYTPVLLEEMGKAFGVELFVGEEAELDNLKVSSDVLEFAFEKVDREKYIQQLLYEYAILQGDDVSIEDCTWENLALMYIESNEELKSEYQTNPDLALYKAKLMSLLEFGMAGAFSEMAVTYDEYVSVMTKFNCLTLEDIVDAVNADPEAMGLPVKDGGELYTRDEIKELVDQSLGQSVAQTGLSLTLVDAETVGDMEIGFLQTGLKVSKRQIILGGKDSKFVIREGVDTTGYALDKSRHYCCSNYCRGN